MVVHCDEVVVHCDEVVVHCDEVVVHWDEHCNQETYSAVFTRSSVSRFLGRGISGHVTVYYHNKLYIYKMKVLTTEKSKL